MLDERYCNSLIFQEFSEDDRIKYFDLKQRKFLHNVDTFYYSIKLNEDFRSDSKDDAYHDLIRTFKQIKYIHSDLEKIDMKTLIPDIQDLYYLPDMRVGYYDIWMECPEYFDIIIASKVPKSVYSEDGSSITSEVIVQLRSYYLWLYGIEKAFEKSYAEVLKVLEHFKLTIREIKENRCDFCWHSNYLQDPENFFKIERFRRMELSTFKDGLWHYEFKPNDTYENDYIALGTRKSNCFVRIYLKTKEVVETSKKPWFFKCWKLHGLINEFDLYCLEQCYINNNDWRFLDKARLKFYLEHGRNESIKETIRDIFDGKIERSNSDIMKLADQLCPKVTKITNVEFQIKRVSTKTYQLLPFNDNSDKGYAARIYDFFDNHKIICEYLTHRVLRLVSLEGDINKSRRDYCPFWASLRKSKMIDVLLTPNDQKLVRKYNHDLNEELLKNQLLNKASTLSIYRKGKNNKDVISDVLDALITLNDNDVLHAKSYKHRTSKRFNDEELAKVVTGKEYHDLVILNREDGTLFSMKDLTDPGDPED